MIGTKKLSTIRAEVRAAFPKSGHDPIEWLDGEIQKLAREPAPDKGELESLMLLRDALQKSTKTRAKKLRRRVRSRSS